MKLSYYGFLLLISLAGLGCAPVMVFVSEPPIQSLETSNYTITFEPLKLGTNSFLFFELDITNRTSKDIQVDWHETLYLYNSRDWGMFVSQDSEPGRVRDPERRYETIAPGQTLQKSIAPLKLVAYAPIKYTQTSNQQKTFSAGPIPEGQSAIRLVLKQGDAKWVETVRVQITKQEATD